MILINTNLQISLNDTMKMLRYAKLTKSTFPAGIFLYFLSRFIMSWQSSNYSSIHYTLTVAQFIATKTITKSNGSAKQTTLLLALSSIIYHKILNCEKLMLVLLLLVLRSLTCVNYGKSLYKVIRFKPRPHSHE